MKKHDHRTMLCHGERLGCTQGRGMRAGSSVKRDSGLQLLGLIQSRPPPPPILPHPSPRSHTHTHTLFLAALRPVVRCALFFQPAQGGIWAGVQADYQQHIARTEDKKKATYPVRLHSSARLSPPSAFPYPVFTHSSHFNARPPWLVSIFPKVLKPHRLRERLLSVFLAGGDVGVSS